MEYKTKRPFLRNCKLPDFLCIGAQKAGTTWLHENLKCHKDVFLPRIKELHYFDAEPLSSLSEYSRHFNRATKNQTIGEITPAYSTLSGSRVRLIKELMPDVRLILILRNPVERAWSQAVMNLITQKGRLISEVSDDEFYNHFQSQASISRTNYLSCIDTYLNYFSEEQLLISFFDEISEHPKDLLARVFSFINVEIPIDWSEYPFYKIIHKSDEVPIPQQFEIKLRLQYADQVSLLKDRFRSYTLGW